MLLACSTKGWNFAQVSYRFLRCSKILVVYHDNSWSLLEAVRNVMAHGDVWEGKWRGNRRLERVATTLALCLRTWSIHGLPTDPHFLTASSRLNWSPRRLNGLRHFSERPNLVSACVPSLFKSATTYLYLFNKIAIPVILDTLMSPPKLFRHKLRIRTAGFLLNYWPLKMGPIGCTKTSVRNYNYSLRNNPAERSSQEITS
jgi:hypothetical protein